MPFAPSLIVPQLRQSLIQLVSLLQANHLSTPTAINSADLNDAFGALTTSAPGTLSYNLDTGLLADAQGDYRAANTSSSGFFHPPVLHPAQRLHLASRMTNVTGLYGSEAAVRAMGLAQFGAHGPPHTHPRQAAPQGKPKTFLRTRGAAAGSRRHGHGHHAAKSSPAGKGMAATTSSTASPAQTAAAAAAAAVAGAANAVQTGLGGPSGAGSPGQGSMAAQDAQCKETLSLLSHVVRESRAVVRPYVGSIYRALKPFMVPTRSLTVRSYALDVAGELCLAGHGCMRAHTVALVSLALDVWQGQASAARRRAAVLALGQIVQGTGYGVDFYREFPQLQAVLLDALKTEVGTRFRRQLLHTLGAIGAVDLVGEREAMASSLLRGGVLELSEDDAMTGREIDGLTLVKTPFELHALKGSEEFFTAAAINSLVTVAMDGSLVHLHPHVMRAFMVIVRYMGQDCLQHLDVIVGTIMHLTRVALVVDATVINGYLADLGKVVRLAQRRIVPHLPHVAQLLFQLWDGSTEVIFLAEQLVAAAGSTIRGYMPVLLARISETFERDRGSHERTTTLKLLRVIAMARDHMQGYVVLVVPELVRLFPEPTAADELSVELGRDALLTLLVVSKSAPLREHVSLLVHRLVRLLPLAALVDDCMLLLAVLARELGNDFTEMGYVRLVNAVTVPLRIQHVVYDQVLRCLVNGDRFPELEPDIDAHMAARGFVPYNTSTKHQDQSLRLAVDQEHLRTAWEISVGATAQDWNDWLRRSTRALLKETPSTAVRACSRLAEIYAPLGRALFNVAFVSCWSALYEEVQEELVQAFEMVLRKPAIAPREIRQVCRSGERERVEGSRVYVAQFERTERGMDVFMEHNRLLPLVGTRSHVGGQKSRLFLDLKVI